MSDSNSRIEQINSLENGKGLQYLMNEAYRIFGNPAVLFNMEYELIACTENIVTDDVLWNELVENGAFSSETTYFFKREAFNDAAASAKSIVLLTSDNLKYDRYYGRVLNCDNSTVVDFIIVACVEPFDDDVPAVVEAFCEKLSKEISADEFYWQYGVTYHQSIIRNLIDEYFDDRILFSDHVANLYEGLKANLFVAVADFSNCNAVGSGLDDFRDLFKRMQPEFKYAVYSGYIIILASTEDRALDVNIDLHKLAAFFEQKNVYAGISRPFENLFALREHYNQAVNALKRGLETVGRQRFFTYNDCTEETER